MAASVERAAEHWFTEGPIVPAVLASAALPGMYPPVEIDGEHYLDGGLVNSIPLDRARKLGAERAFVLQVGRIEQPLARADPAVGGPHGRPRGRPAGPASTPSLERALESMEVHVLPTGGLAPKPTERANFDPFDTSRVAERMHAARRRPRRYLVEHGLIAPRSPCRESSATPLHTSATDCPRGAVAVTLPLRPDWVRRLVLDPFFWFAGFWLLVMALPYLVILLAVLSFVLPGKWRLLRLPASPSSTWPARSSSCPLRCHLAAQRLRPAPARGPVDRVPLSGARPGSCGFSSGSAPDSSA